MIQDERDKFVADEIRAGRCPFGSLKEGQTMAHCPSGFPGCGCADELMLNEYLNEKDHYRYSDRPKEKKDSAQANAELEYCGNKR